MPPILTADHVSKVYDSGHRALDGASLEIEDGEILALLGPNGAGKTTLISVICGLVSPSGGTITVGGHDAIREFRAARALIGLVPQEISLEPFETVWNTVRFSRGLFGKPRDDARLEGILRDLSLWDKKNAPIRALSGGMKRRVLIAKALSHEPRVLFLDEPTAGVDVELRKDMWQVVRKLQQSGVTIVLTTHYIEEAEAMADRVAVINKGRVLLVEEKTALMARMGRKELRIDLGAPLAELPSALARFGLSLDADGERLILVYDGAGGPPPLVELVKAIEAEGLAIADMQTRQSSLEEIFVGLVADQDAAREDAA